MGDDDGKPALRRTRGGSCKSPPLAPSRADALGTALVRLDNGGAIALPNDHKDEGSGLSRSEKDVHERLFRKPLGVIGRPLPPGEITPGDMLLAERGSVAVPATRTERCGASGGVLKPMLPPLDELVLLRPRLGCFVRGCFDLDLDAATAFARTISAAARYSAASRAAAFSFCCCCCCCYPSFSFTFPVVSSPLA